MKTTKYAYDNFRWVTCDVIGENEDGDLLIRYAEPRTGMFLEDEVDVSCVGEFEINITDTYIRSLAEAVISRLKKDGIILNELQLEQLSIRLEHLLKDYFND